MKILTFDIEEWFHILDNESTKNERQWVNFEYRLESNLERILELLNSNNQKATFFCLGWIAKKFPNVLKKIDRYKYEIGTHSNLHTLVYEQTQSEFKSKGCLEKSNIYVRASFNKNATFTTSNINKIKLRFCRSSNFREMDKYDSKSKKSD